MDLRYTYANVMMRIAHSFHAIEQANRLNVKLPVVMVKSFFGNAKVQQVFTDATVAISLTTTKTTTTVLNPNSPSGGYG